MNAEIEVTSTARAKRQFENCAALGARRGRSRWVLVAFALVAVGALASPARAVDVVGGFKAGFTWSDMFGNDLADPTAMSNFTGGGILGWEIEDWFAVQVEPLWTQKGAELKNYAVGVYPATLNLDYFEIPVLAKFKRAAGEDRRSGFFGVLGPVIALRLRANLEIAGDATNVSEYVHQADWGAAFGAGYDISLGRGVTTIDVRYVMGLSDVFQDDAPEPEVTGGLKNGALQITVGWFTGIF